MDVMPSFHGIFLIPLPSHMLSNSAYPVLHRWQVVSSEQMSQLGSHLSTKYTK